MCVGKHASLGSKYPCDTGIIGTCLPTPCVLRSKDTGIFVIILYIATYTYHYHIHMSHPILDLKLSLIMRIGTSKK